MTTLASAPEPHPGWAVVRRCLEGKFAVVQARVERAPLAVGGTSTVLSAEQYVGWLQQQTAMVEVLGRLLPTAVAGCGQRSGHLVVSPALTAPGVFRGRRR